MVMENLTEADRALTCVAIVIALALILPFAVRDAERWLQAIRSRAVSNLRRAPPEAADHAPD